ncbi:8534_t:CDS:2, partial [Gigaspora rosea]
EDENYSTSGLTSSDSLALNNTLISKKQTILFKYIGRPLCASEISKFERLIENPEVRELFHFISPHLKLPDQKSLSNRILTSATNEVQATIKNLVCSDKIGITIAFDGWRNIVNQELIGVVFIMSSRETLIWEAKDISIERQRQEETLVTKALDNDLKLPTEIKIAVNRDSFWNSLTTLHKILHSFCGSLDLMQHQVFEEINTDDINEEITSKFNWNVAISECEESLIDKEFEEEQDDLDIADIDFLDLETHPAENQAA